MKRPPRQVQFLLLLTVLLVVDNGEEEREKGTLTSRAPTGLLQQLETNGRHALDRRQGPVGAKTGTHSPTTWYILVRHSAMQPMEGSTAHVPKDATRTGPTNWHCRFWQTTHQPQAFGRRRKPPVLCTHSAFAVGGRIVQTVASAKSSLRDPVVRGSGLVPSERAGRLSPRTCLLGDMESDHRPGR